MAAKRSQSKSPTTKRTTRKKPPGEKQGHTPDNVVELSVVAGGADIDKRPDLQFELGATARTAWDRFWDSVVAQQVIPSDYGALVRWIEAVQERADLQAAISRIGVTVEGSKKNVRMNPLYNRLNRVEQIIADAEQEFGMTPLARNKLGYVVGQHALTASEVNKIAAEEAARRAKESGSDKELEETLTAEGFEIYTPAD